MGKKYIIELEDKPFHKDGDFLCRVKGFNSLVFDMTSISKLTPYIEPDLEKIRKEAYEKGYCIGYSKYLNKSYEDGLKDAWEAARKIWEYDLTTLREIFGEGIMRMDFFMKFTASEVIEEIRAYEQAQKEKEEQTQKEEEKPISVEEVMRQYLDEFCKRHWCCAGCVLRTDDFTCGRGYDFTGINHISDEEVRRAYAEVMKK